MPLVSSYHPPQRQISEGCDPFLSIPGLTDAQKNATWGRPSLYLVITHSQDPNSNRMADRGHSRLPLQGTYTRKRPWKKAVCIVNLPGIRREDMGEESVMVHSKGGKTEPDLPGDKWLRLAQQLARLHNHRQRAISEPSGLENRPGLLEGSEPIGTLGLEGRRLSVLKSCLSKRISNPQTSPKRDSERVSEYPRPYHLDLGTLLGAPYSRNLFVAALQENTHPIRIGTTIRIKP